MKEVSGMENISRTNRGNSQLTESLHSPRSIAVIGASKSKGKIGHAVLSNMIESGFKGSIYPINPGSEEILGLRSYPDVDAVEGAIDLAVVVIPARLVLDVLKACGRRGGEDRDHHYSRIP
ncbi:MAG TPA: hypothetical protein ENO25_00685 [Desulfobacteraceae bacterium]|nr:hypothetical protein [Desulfobacteraceae bacterium]